jgi:hypothetical protein
MHLPHARCHRCVYTTLHGREHYQTSMALRWVALLRVAKKLERFGAVIVAVSAVFLAGGALTAVHVEGAAAPPATNCPQVNAQTLLPANLSYFVPPGFKDGSRTVDPFVDLVAPSGANGYDDIRFLPNPSESISGHPMTRVAGLTAYVMVNVARTGAFGTYVRDVVMVCGSGTQYLISCRSGSGPDNTIVQGCARFTSSLSFTPPAPALYTGTHCPVIPPPTADLITTITCVIPRGYNVVQSQPGSGAILLTAPVSGSSRAQIVLSWNPSSNVIPSISTGVNRFTIDGCPAFVLDDNASGGAYLKEVWIECGADKQYVVVCRGYSGYDQSLAVDGCDSFLSSLRIVPAPRPTAGPTPSGLGVVPFSPVGLPISVAFIMGVWGWVIIRFLSWAWPRVFAMFRNTFGAQALGCLFAVSAVLGVTNVLSNPLIARDLFLVFWPIVLVSGALEALWRTARHWRRSIA